MQRFLSILPQLPPALLGAETFDAIIYIRNTGASIDIKPAVSAK